MTKPLTIRDIDTEIERLADILATYRQTNQVAAGDTHPADAYELIDELLELRHELMLLATLA